MATKLRTGVITLSDHPFSGHTTTQVSATADIGLKLS